MSSWFDKWGLSPQERRFVVIVGIVVFVLINWWVVIPMFGDWGRFNQRIDDTRKQVEKYNAEIRKKAEYEKKRNELRSLGGGVSSEEAALRLQQDVVNQANLVGLGYGTITPGNRGASSAPTSKTNLFDEASVNVSINTGEKELVDFLVRLADKEMLIRAKSMDIGPDLSHTRLAGNLTLVKSFQRKPPPQRGGTANVAGKPAPTATPPPTPTPTPAGTQTPPPKVDTKPKTPPAVTSAPPARAASPGTNPVTVPTRSLPRPVK